MEEVLISIDTVQLRGVLTIPKSAIGAVLFAHGAGSSRKSPRNVLVAEALHDAGCATLLFDLLTEEEDQVYERRFDIPLLIKRLTAATRWVSHRPDIGALPMGYFGASTGSAAALGAAVEFGPRISAVVSRGGRPDLAADALARVASPTLLIVGGADTEVVELNRVAYSMLTCEKRFAIIPDATHLFEEPGALEQVAALAGKWFRTHFERVQKSV